LAQSLLVALVLCFCALHSLCCSVQDFWLIRCHMGEQILYVFMPTTATMLWNKNPGRLDTYHVLNVIPGEQKIGPWSLLYF
jgi:hypothetical protein